MKPQAIQHKKYFRKWCIVALFFWCALVLSSALFIINTEWKAAMAIGRELGISSLKKDYIYRAWSAGHGGVYVPVSKETPPNPFLSHIPNRDMLDRDGRELTLINPAYMTRQVHELGLEMYGLRAHITSLKVIRPENKADGWEISALKQFEHGVEEVVELVTLDNQPFMRVMTPTQTRESCLKCHADQGYKIGDIRGGISVSIPMLQIIGATKKKILLHCLYHLLIFMAGAAALYIFWHQTGKHLAARTEAENDLKKQEAHLRGIVNNISNGIAVYERSEDDDDFIIKSINPAGLEHAQLTLAEVVGKRVTEVLPAVVDVGLFAVLQRVWQTGESQHLPITGYDNERISLWVENYVYKLSTGEIVAVYDDVTARKQAEEQLLKKTEEWKKTFDAIPDIVTLLDKDMKIIRANQAASDLFQMTPEQLQGSNCYKLFIGDGQPCKGCHGILSLTDFKEHSNVIEHTPLGKTFYVSSAPVLDHNNEVQYFVSIAQDVTEKKRLEQELFQAQKMEAIGTLAGGIAHDFNNILAAIIGYAEIARMKLPDSSGVARNIDEVITAGNRATELVKQILTFSRKEQQEQQPLQICLLVKEAVKMMRSSLPSTIEMGTCIDENGGMVLADPTSIHQLVVNLCTNASHAIGNDQGKMEVSLRHEELAGKKLTDKSEKISGSFIVLTVQDSGIGMDEKTRARIFEPYFTTKESGKGTGLGLAVIHGIVEQCNGFIEVESSPGRGSVFRIFLPVIDEDLNELAAEEDNEPFPTGTESILLVDDEQPLTKIGSSILTSLGYNVTVENRSHVALEIFQADPASFDLVITDQTMPDLTGVDLAGVMLKVRPDLPIILCTGYTSAITEEEVYAVGIKFFATKPLSKRTLAGLVRQALDG